MNVARIHDHHGSHIEPPLNPDWDDHTKLLWQAAVIMEDTDHCIPIEIQKSNYSMQIDGQWVPQLGYYNITIGSTTAGPLDYERAWTCLNGVAIGLRARQ